MEGLGAANGRAGSELSPWPLFKLQRGGCTHTHALSGFFLFNQELPCEQTQNTNKIIKKKKQPRKGKRQKQTRVLKKKKNKLMRTRAEAGPRPLWGLPPPWGSHAPGQALRAGAGDRGPSDPAPTSPHPWAPGGWPKPHTRVSAAGPARLLLLPIWEPAWSQLGRG